MIARGFVRVCVCVRAANVYTNLVLDRSFARWYAWIDQILFER